MALERVIGKGGEGEVHTVAGEPNYAVKLYAPKLRAERRAKISAMVKSELHKKSPLAAFPIAVVHMSDGSFGGFVMKLMNGFRAVHELYAPGSRKNHFPQADYRFLARAASNIARAFASVHHAGCVVGDINHSGIFVSKEATAALIDADSFQFSDGSKQYLCNVGVPEYTPPELQGKPFTGIVRTTDHDAFGLAVIVFQLLLMGRHPFVGTVRRGELPPIHENIKQFRYVYAETRNVGMDQPPGTPALQDFSPELAQLFERAFSQSMVGKRPSAADWVTALDRFESTLVKCQDNSLHYGPKDASECPWCEMERQVGVVLFLPYLSTGPSFATTDDPGTEFDLQNLWVRVARINLPPYDRILPKVPVLSLGPSTVAKEALAKVNQSTVSPFAVLGLLFAFFLLFLGPRAWGLSVIVGAASLVKLANKGHGQIDGPKFKAEFINAKNQWYRDLEDWRMRAMIDDVDTLLKRLQSARQEYIDLANEQTRQINEYRRKREEKQRHAFLEGFDLTASSIQGIGLGRLATLSSYGIDTAADISVARLHGVPGFGEVLIDRMLEWQAKQATRFVYNSADNDADRREYARIRSTMESKASSLRSALKNGVQELEVKANRINGFCRTEDTLLSKSYQRVEQAIKDLNFLSLTIPTVDPPPRILRSQPPPVTAAMNQSVGNQPSRSPWQAPARSPAPASMPSSVKQSSSAAPQCPRCGMSMQKRLARKGRNAGNYFWGCSRFPVCKGTRQI